MDDDKKRLYNALNVGMFIFVEDEFQFNEIEDEAKAHILIDFARMDEADRRALLGAIPDETPGKNELQHYADADSWIFEINWSEVPQDDVEHILKNRPDIMELYKAIPNNLWEEACQQVFLRYGVGIVIQDVFKPLFRKVIREAPRYLPTRIYKAYTAEVRQLIMQDFKTCNAQGKSAAVVLDNMVDEERHAEQMVKDLENRDVEACCPIYATIFSTVPQTGSGESCETADLYIGYTNKSEQLDGVHKNIARAAINLLIQKYKARYKMEIDSNCDTLAKNPELVEYLYGMARAEGEPGYEVMQQWIEFMASHHMEQSDEMVQLIKISGSLEAYKSKVNYDLKVPKALIDAACSENFLAAVNKFCTATAPGDIFFYKGKLYILVGQDCDYMMGEKRRRHSPLCEFVSAEYVKQGDIDKLSDDEKYVYVNNYKHSDGNTYVLKINYGTRLVICNEIINLCSFNQEGFCRIDSVGELSEEVSALLQPYMLEYYRELREYFKLVKAVKTEVPDFFTRASELKVVEPLIDISNYQEQGDILDYGIQRISRLKKTASLYLYKMFLEYRGRMPYTTINLTGYSSVIAEIRSPKERRSTTIHIKLTNDRRKNQDKQTKLTWYINREILQKAVNVIVGEGHSLAGEDDYIELSGNVETELSCGDCSVILKKQVENESFYIDLKLREAPAE